MSKFNYSKQFAKKEVELTAEGPIVEESVVVETLDGAPVGEETKPAELKPAVQEVTTKTGVVTGCEKLRVRKGPSKQLNPVAIIDKGSEVTILKELPDWYQVRIAGGIVGYCMAEFIAVK